MDLESALKAMFPQVDARLIKATLLDCDDMDSAMDFLLKESMLSDEQKSDENISPDSHYVHIDEILIRPDSKKHHGSCNQDEVNLIDFDKHEESIVWKGGPRSNIPMNVKVICPDDVDEFHGPSLQDQPIVAGNQHIDWWATTWPNGTGPKNHGDMYTSFSSSSMHTDSDTQEVGTLVWSNMDIYKPIQQKDFAQGGATVDIDHSSTGSTESFPLEKENMYLWSPASCLNKSDTSCKSLAELGLPLSQEHFKILNPEALAVSMIEVERSDSRSGDKHGFATDDNCNISSSGIVRSVWEDSFFQENLPESSRYNINTEDLNNLFNEAKRCKENVRKDMENIYLLRQRTEQEELAAQRARTEAARSGLEIFLKVEDVRQQTSSQRAEYEMRSAEIYGEKSILAMEARELKARLLETGAEQAKALSLLDSIRCSLSARLEKASQEKQFAMEETNMKVQKAEELLASEQASAQKLEHSFKVLEAEAETCKKLREFLIERGNVVDSLQGEMAVLCEDVLTFKEQVDEGIPLSAGSRSLSWSRMSHLTERVLLTSPPGEVKDCGASRCVPLESSACLNSISSTSILTLSSATSESPKLKRPIECALHSQFFSPGISMIDVADQGLSREVIKDEKKDGQEGGKEIVESLDSMGSQFCYDGKEQKDHLNSAGSCGQSVVEAEVP